MKVAIAVMSLNQMEFSDSQYRGTCTYRALDNLGRMLSVWMESTNLYEFLSLPLLHFGRHKVGLVHEVNLTVTASHEKSLPQNVDFSFQLAFRYRHPPFREAMRRLHPTRVSSSSPGVKSRTRLCVSNRMLLKFRWKSGVASSWPTITTIFPATNSPTD